MSGPDTVSFFKVFFFKYISENFVVDPRNVDLEFSAKKLRIISSHNIIPPNELMVLNSSGFNTGHKFPPCHNSHDSKFADLCKDMNKSL